MGDAPGWSVRAVDPPGIGTGPPLTYLDHAASAPLRPEVAEAMAPFSGPVFGHPSGSHRQARAARGALEEAREQVALAMGCAPADVVFTSGGTEADNLAVFGVLAASAQDRPGRPTVVVSSAVEHSAVLAPCRAAVARLPGVEHREVAVDGRGVLRLDRLADALDDDVALVTVMLANNEVGAVQPLADVVAVTAARAPGAAVHTDAVQAAPWVDLSAEAAGAALVSISAHKLGGPKGSGALVVREGTPLLPLMMGGGQERERRAGTHDVAGAVGLAAALTAAAAERDGERVRVAALRDRLADGLLAAVPALVEPADRKDVLPSHCHLCFSGVDREELVLLLDEAGVCVSAGAACASGALEPSHVMAAMGVDAADARGAIRFSLGHTSTPADVERALAVVPEAVARLRG